MSRNMVRFPNFWIKSPYPAEINDSEVHIWATSFALTETESAFEKAMAILSDEENERAHRFRLQNDRRRFVFGRAMTRYILSRYLQTPPFSFRFQYAALGKPAVEFPNHDREITFNVSHAGELLMLAVSRKREVGIDVERIHSTDWNGLSKRFFTPHEFEVLRSFPAEQQLQNFFRLWVRKEAYLKMRGEGLSAGLNSFSAIQGANGFPENCKIEELPGIDEYCAAVAAEGVDWQLQYFVGELPDA